MPAPTTPPGQSGAPGNSGGAPGQQHRPTPLADPAANLPANATAAQIHAARRAAWKASPDKATRQQARADRIAAWAS